MSYKKILLKKARGFTLIELLVVVAIIGILAGLLIPGLMSKTVEAKISKAKNNAQLVYNAAQQWLQTEIIDKDQVYPSGTYCKDDGSAVATGIQNELDQSHTFYGTWAVTIDSSGGIYALWSKDTTVNLVSQTQMTLQDLKSSKGKIGCYPIK